MFISLPVVTYSVNISMLACTALLVYYISVLLHDSNSICVILCDSQPTPRSTSTHLELGESLSISLYSTPLLLYSTPLLLLLFLLLSPLDFSLSTPNPSPLSKCLWSFPGNLPSASACPPLLPPIILSFLSSPLLPFLLRPPVLLSSTVVQDLLCRTCLLLHRVESQVHSMTVTPG